MTGLKRSLDLNRKEGVLFISGACLIIIIQAFIAVTFAKYLTSNPTIVENLSIAAIFVFLALSILFFYQAKQKISLKEKNQRRSSFLAGSIMASMNMLAIPFFLGYSTLMESQGWLNTEFPHNFIFALGAGMGAFTLFFGYILLAEIIHARLQIVARNINTILGILFLTLAIITTYNTLT